MYTHSTATGFGHLALWYQKKEPFEFDPHSIWVPLSVPNGRPIFSPSNSDSISSLLRLRPLSQQVEFTLCDADPHWHIVDFVYIMTNKANGSSLERSRPCRSLRVLYWTALVTHRCQGQWKDGWRMRRQHGSDDGSACASNRGRQTKPVSTFSCFHVPEFSSSPSTSAQGSLRGQMNTAAEHNHFLSVDNPVWDGMCTSSCQSTVSGRFAEGVPAWVYTQIVTHHFLFLYFFFLLEKDERWEPRRWTGEAKRKRTVWLRKDEHEQSTSTLKEDENRKRITAYITREMQGIWGRFFCGSIGVESTL